MHTLKALQQGQITLENLGADKRLRLAEGLTEFPEEVYQLAEHIEILDMSGNELTSLPDDFGRLKNLKILFLSNNKFDHLPEVISDCPKLEMIGFKSNQIKTVAEGSIPLDTRWLILTDNQIEKLPSDFGKLTRLRKLALAGNNIQSLPESMANCTQLELIRLSANHLSEIPDWLLQLPKLSWLALSGNPVTSKYRLDSKNLPHVSVDDFRLVKQLGEGASGVIHLGKGSAQSAFESKDMAIKVFKGEITSDGYPKDELKCCLAAGDHDNLIKTVAQINQPGQLGLVMELIPRGFRNLGLPPTLETCTRDTFELGSSIRIKQLMLVGLQMADALKQLHRNKVSHGDIYAHNIMVNFNYSVLFGDFGAATHMGDWSDVHREAMESIEVRALGCLLQDLTNLLDEDEKDKSGYREIEHLIECCLSKNLNERPSFSEIQVYLESAMGASMSNIVVY